MTPPDGDPDTTDSASEYIEPVIGREADVRKRIDKALPSIEWSSECGVYNREGCTFEFSLSAQRGHVNEIWVHVDGPRNTDIFPLLCDLAGANGWILQDCQTRKVIDQQTPSRDGWDKVHNFRERVETAIETMQRA